MRPSALRRSLRTVAALGAAAVGLGAVAVAALAPSGASAVFDIDEAKAELAAFVDANPALPAGTETPASGPRCPLVTPEELVAVAGGTGTDLRTDFAAWYGFARVDAELHSDTGERVTVVECVAAPDAAGLSLFALDISPFEPASGLDVDRVARRFGVGQVVRVEPPTIGGEVAGRCDAGRCLALWHRDGFILGLALTGGAQRSAAELLVDLVPEMVDTLIVGLPPTTTTTTTTSTSTPSTTSSTTTSTTSTTTTTTLPPATTTSSTTTTTTEPPTTTTTTLPPATTTTTTTTEPPTTTTTPSTTTTTTLPPTTTTSSTTTTTLPPTTTTTTTLPPTTTTTTSTTLAPAGSLWEAIGTNPLLTQFAAAVQSADLVDLLSGVDPEHPQLTVLAPTDDALAELPEWSEIQADPERLERFVLAHLLPGAIPVDTLFTPTDPPTDYRTLNDDLLVIDPVARTVNGAVVETADVATPNGLLDSVDAVIVVPPVASPDTVPATEAASPPATVADVAPPDTAPPGS